MKKFIAGLLPVVLFTFGVASAGIINQKDVQTLSSCNSAESHEVYYYIPENKSITIYPDDTYWNSHDAFISKGVSSVDIYRNGVISQCSDWDRMSNFVRGGAGKQYAALIFRNDDGCVLSKPNYTKTNNPSAIDAQIHYTVGINLAGGGVGEGKATNNGKFYYVAAGSDKYTCYPDWKEVSSTTECTSSSLNYWTEPDYHLGECLNYHVFRCGDGLVNSPNPNGYYYDNGYKYEECDPAAPEWKNRTDGKSCNASCKIEYAASSCGTLNGNTAYNSNYSSPRITETTSGLCGVGELVSGSFSYNAETGKYTWSCKNGNASAVACNAQDLWCGDGTVQSAYEQCDLADTRSPSVKGWGEGTLKTCSSSCKLQDIDGPVCNSQYDGQTKYQSISLGEWLNKNMNPSLCTNGQVNGFKSDGKSPRTFTWNCEVNGVTKGCTAKQEWCGDGIKNGSEVCDPADTTNKVGWGDGCSATCDKATYDSGVCGEYHTKKTYLSIDKDRLTANTQGLCSKGTVINFHKHTSSHVYTWQCSNGGNPSDTCRADQEWCGDEVLQPDHESCDDGNKNGTSSSSCSSTCTKVTGVSCGENDGGTTYFANRQTTSWLSKTSGGMCPAGLTVGAPTIVGTDYHIEWTCSNANGASVPCKAYQAYCGDEIVQSDHEACDEGSKNGTSSSSCSSTCTKVTGVSCGENDGGTTYFANRQTTSWLSKTSGGMCPAGLTVGAPTIVGTDYHIEWTCSNANGASVPCKAYQAYCGDEIVQSDHEACDDGSKNGTSSSSCSSTCTKVVSNVSCGEKDGGTTYFDNRQENPWLSKTSEGMCAAGLTVGEPKIKGIDNHLEWTCSNANGAEKTCKAYQEYCGDEVLQSDHEECDYNDKNETNWGNDGCDTSCKQKIEVPGECDVNSTFHYTLRQGWQYTFHDTFVPSATRYLYDFDVTFEEQKPYDYNRGANPSFYWADDLGNGVYKEVSTTRMVIKSKPPYPIYDHPNVRSYNNLYIEYNIKYADKAYSTKPDDSKLKTHKECVFYEISRCGDGVLDTNWEGKGPEDEAEECDPGSEGTKVLPDGRICNSECKIVTVNPPVCNSVYHGQRVENLTENDKLCSEGTASKFTYNSTTHKWTWECSNVAGKEDCRATKPYCGDGIKDAGEQCDPKDPNHEGWGNGTCNNSCELEYPKGELHIVKTLKDKVPVEYTGQVLKWTVEVTASKGDVTDFQIQDLLPEALIYSGYRVVSNTDNLVVTGPTGPVKSGSNNVYTWMVKGTLKENHKLTLEITTEVVKMPKSSDDYRNVACVVKDGDIDCANDQPPVPKGELHIVKTLKDKVPVEYTGQVLKWTVEVTASKGDVTDFQIQDLLPEALIYSGYRVVSNTDNLVVTGPTGPVKSGSNNVYTWMVKGTLKENHKLTLEITTEVVKMPKSSDDYRNVACVIKDNYKECGNDQPPVPGELEVVKTLISKNKYVTHTGQELVWSITVTAKNGDVAMERIKDKLPAVLDYSGYKPEVVPSGITVYEPTFSKDRKEITWKTTGTLKSGKSIVLYVYTTVNAMPEKTVENVACAKPVDPGDEECGTGHVSDVRIKKFVWNGTKWDKIMTGKVGDPIKYQIEFGNNGDESVFVVLKDYLPKGVKFIKGTLVVGSQSNAGSVSDGNLNMVYKGETIIIDGIKINTYTGVLLRPNQSGVLTIEGEILEPKTENENRTNFACIFDNEGNKIDCDDAKHDIEDSLSCKKPTLSKSSFDKVCSSDTSTFSTIVTCNSSSDTDIEILCDGKVIKTGHTSQLTGTCSATTNDTDHIVQCKVNGKTVGENGEECRASFRRDTKSCGGSSGGGGGGGNPPEYPPVGTASCFNINAGNFSIEKGEILPFYWNIEKLGDEDNYIEYKKNTYKYEDAMANYDEYFDGNKSCSEDDHGKMALNSMVCTFRVYNGGTYKLDERNNNRLYEIQGPCLSTPDVVIKSSLVKDWLKYMEDHYGNGYFADDVWNDTNYTFRASIYYIENFGKNDVKTYLDGGKYIFKKNSNANIAEFGEYKLVLSEIKFLQCYEGEWVKKSGSTCESNFAVTTSYTVQKTPSGNLKASTQTLHDFIEMAGKRLSEYLNEVMAVSEYEPNSQVTKAMTDFINKYEKLAVKVGDEGMKKVPGKSIYFIDSSRKINDSDFTKPVTFVQTNPDAIITIEGNVKNLNMMVLSKGKIKFTDPNNCKNRQVVRGIFYAEKGIERSLVTKNTSINNPHRCTEGGLTIKGVLIGKGLQGMMENSRSNLNNWFNTSAKKDTVMNGASVLIEYSPSVFTQSSMPPGAEDFTTALSIYKQ